MTTDQEWGQRATDALAAFSQATQTAATRMLVAAGATQNLMQQLARRRLAMIAQREATPPPVEPQ